jgi:hypothetical protein
MRRCVGRMVLMLALLLAAVACGGEEKPPAAGDSGPVVAGACAPDTPDCVDTVVVGDGEPGGTVEPGGAPGAGMPADGGLSVEEALQTDATGVLAVRGFVVTDASSARLCDLLAESFPPQCGGAAIDLANLDGIDEAELESAQGVQWTNLPVVVFGEVIDGVLVPSTLVSG